MHPLIDLQNIYKIYNPGENEVRALCGIRLQIETGEYAAIIGQSGSGKSTLMNILGCLDAPSRGTYRLDGDDVINLPDYRLSEIRNQRIGFVFQGFNLIPSLSALENVELPLIYRGINKSARKKIATEALERVGLLDRIHHRPAQLSGGQQQRVAIARAISARPPIILADEPTGNLDSASGTEVIKIIQELNADGHTIILITHDREIASTAHRIIHIHDGQIDVDKIA